MSLIKKKFLANGAIAKLLNDTFIVGRNAANSADVNVIGLDGNDKIKVGADLLPSGSHSLGSSLLPFINANIQAIKDGADTIIDVQSEKLYGAGFESIDFGLREIKASDGSTSINYSSNAEVTFSVPIDMSGQPLTNLPAPTASSEAATKNYVDTEIAGIDLSGYIPTSQKGANNGVAELDAGGKVPVSQLPSSLMSYEGTWNASTNTPTLADGTGNAGDVYIVSTAGTQNLGSGNITFAIGDWVIYNGSIWQLSSNSNSVVSVNSQTGVVVLDTDDVAEGTTNKYAKTWAKESITLVAGDITNQYVDLAETIQASSLDLVVDGVMQTEGVDYTINLTGGSGGVTRLTFAGDLATAGASALVATDILRIKYQY